MGLPPNLEDDNASTNVSINDDSDEFSERVSDERQAKKNLGTERRINFQEETLRLEKSKIKLMGERLMKKSQAEEDCLFLMNLLPSIKKLDDIQRLELRIIFLSSVTSQISKNLSPPFSSVPTALTISCPPTPSPRAASLDSTHSRDSDNSTHSPRMSCVSSADLLASRLQV